MKDYYYILGIESGATSHQIKVAYRKLSKKFHPDKNEGDEFFNEHFKELHEAYEVLSNPDKRKDYDIARRKEEELRYSAEQSQQRHESEFKHTETKPPPTPHTPSSSSQTATSLKSERHPQDSMIGGVCGGLGEYTSIPSWGWRLLFSILLFVYGIGLFIYIILWMYVSNGQAEKKKLGEIWNDYWAYFIIVPIIIIVAGIIFTISQTKDFTKREEPAPAEAYYNKGRNFIDLGQYQRAIENFNEAIRLQSDDAEAYVLRGIAYAELGQYQRAIEDSNKAIRLKPDNYIAYWFRGTTYRNIGQYQRAIEDYNEAIRLQPDSADAYANRGSAYAYLSQYNKAREDFDKAISLKPDNSSAYYGYACMFALQKDATQACSWLWLAIERGYKDWKHIKEDKDFDNIRNTACFIDILNKSGK